jgi:hypothetical protein
LNECENVTVERFAAYDHNAIAAFVPGADSFDGLTNVRESDAKAINRDAIRDVHCVRIDDYFESVNALILSIRGDGDVDALAGAEATLSRARILFMEFDHGYYARHPEMSKKLAALLERAFVHCYAPQTKVTNSGARFADLFAHLMSNRSSECLIFSKQPIV